MEKRGQVFLEFLFTYGWAIMAVLISLGSLTYFGVINPKNFPELCLMDSGISCDDFVVYDDGNIILELTNHLGQTLNNVQVSLINENGAICLMGGSGSMNHEARTTYSSDDPTDINCIFEAGTFVRLEISATYETGSAGLSHELGGVLNALVVDAGAGGGPGDPEGGPEGGPVCGDGVVEGEEQCDDGNIIPGDGCSASCTAEAPPLGCGNNFPNPGEACDDGNNLNCDGCNWDCSRADNVCGDGISECSEQCDDSNIFPGDGCSDSCTAEGGVLPEEDGGFCGDGNIDFGEDCDDGSQCTNGIDCTTKPVNCQSGDECVPHSGDGCDVTCALEMAPAFCGNGIVETDNGEVCDDGNNLNCDGCNWDCSRADNVCGDGIVECGEECDGKILPASPEPIICNAECIIEVVDVSGTCGNGQIDTGEQCDDGNTIPGDGCDENCLLDLLA